VLIFYWKGRYTLFDTSRKRLIKTGILSLLLVLVLGYTIIREGIDTPMLFVSVILISCIAAAYLLDINFSKKISTLLMIILPLAGFYLLEGYTHYAWEISWQIQILNVIFFVLVFGLLLIILGKGKNAAAVALSLMMILGIANYYTTQFRSSPILPWDFLSLSTAMSVTNNYNFSVTYRLLVVTLGFVLCIVLAGKLDLTVKSLKIRAGFAAAGIVCLIFFTGNIQTDAAKETFKLNDILFTPDSLYESNGFAVSFLVNLQYINVDKPTGYSAAAVNGIIEKTESEYESVAAESPAGTDGTEMPNIIVVMNETFSDLSVLGDFETNEDYMPFFRTLKDKENTVTGNLFTSVKGGNTANTEFEFLTGNTMAFLPLGSIAYQQYINSAIPNLSQNLENNGYSTLAIHPFGASGWDRNEVYEYFGFDTTWFIDEFYGAETIRQYVTDRAAYGKIIEAFESKGDDEKLFTFEVTMQNHGGYYNAYDNFTETIELLNAPNIASTTYTERYLSLIKESDIAFEELLAYFESVDEPTMIVMFGDHQPADTISATILEMNGKTGNESLEEEQARYVVPFAIWANFDIEEEQVDYISANYLSTLLLEKAGAPLTGYQKFLTQLRKVLPVITANVYIDADGNYYNSTDNPYVEHLRDYAILQYNNLFDEKNRVDSFFTTANELASGNQE